MAVNHLDMKANLRHHDGLQFARITGQPCHGSLAIHPALPALTHPG